MTKFIACINEISSAKVTSTLLVYELSANASHRQVAIDAHRLFLNRRQVDWKIWICIMTKISLFLGCMKHLLRMLAPSISWSRESRKKPSFRIVLRGAASVLVPARQVCQKFAFSVEVGFMLESLTVCRVWNNWIRSSSQSTSTTFISVSVLYTLRASRSSENVLNG